MYPEPTAAGLSTLILKGVVAHSDGASARRYLVVFLGQPGPYFRHDLRTPSIHVGLNLRPSSGIQIRCLVQLARSVGVRVCPEGGVFIVQPGVHVCRSKENVHPTDLDCNSSEVKMSGGLLAPENSNSLPGEEVLLF